jgi:hypothetical protein
MSCDISMSEGKNGPSYDLYISAVGSRSFEESTVGFSVQLNLYPNGFGISSRYFSGRE